MVTDILLPKKHDNYVEDLKAAYAEEIVEECNKCPTDAKTGLKPLITKHPLEQANPLQPAPFLLVDNYFAKHEREGDILSSDAKIVVGSENYDRLYITLHEEALGHFSQLFEKDQNLMVFDGLINHTLTDQNNDMTQFRHAYPFDIASDRLTANSVMYIHRSS